MAQGLFALNGPLRFPLSTRRPDFERIPLPNRVMSSLKGAASIFEKKEDGVPLGGSNSGVSRLVLEAEKSKKAGDKVRGGREKYGT